MNDSNPSFIGSGLETRYTGTEYIAVISFGRSIKAVFGSGDITGSSRGIQASLVYDYFYRGVHHEALLPRPSEKLHSDAFH